MKKDNMSAKQYICYGIIIAVAGGLIIKYFEYLIDNDLRIKNFFFTFEINYLSLILILMLFAIALYISYKKSSRKNQNAGIVNNIIITKIGLFTLHMSIIMSFGRYIVTNHTL